jgi:hypothetical protein
MQDSHISRAKTENCIFQILLHFIKGESHYKNVTTSEMYLKWGQFLLNP